MVRIVRGVAPVRVCDIGGWTDTWFAGHGRVLNVAVSPGVLVRAAVYAAGEREHHVLLHAENYGDRYPVVPGGTLPGRHPLLEAAIDEVGVRDDVAVELTVRADVPPGCATGTSAAVTVALVGVLAHVAGRRMTADEVARTAHRIEAERLGLQSGVQDQLCSAHGGISLIEMDAYPHATVSPVQIPQATWAELERRLVLVYLGRPHASSDVHSRVIARLSEMNGWTRELDVLRALALDARNALCAGDLRAFGDVMCANTEAQAALHPELVSAVAREVIAVAGAHGAVGWKVNGAGGDGGSLTVLCGPEVGGRVGLLRALGEVSPGMRMIPARLSRSGLRVRES